MPPADVQELLGAYALGALDDDEQILVERLLERSPEARDEVARHLEVAEHLGTMATSSPPSDLWDRINDRAAQRPLAPAEPPIDEPEPVGDEAPDERAVDTQIFEAPPRRHTTSHAAPVENDAAVSDLTEVRSRRGGAAWFITSAAAAVAVVLAVALVAQTQRLGNLNETIAAQDRQNQDLTNEISSRDAQIAGLNDTITVQSDQIEEINSVLASRDSDVADLLSSLSQDPLQRAADLAAADPSSVLVSLAAPEAGQPQLTIVLQQDGRGYVTDSELSPLDPERTYQLWAIFGDGRVISAAVLGNQPGADTFVVDMDDLVALAVTEEIDGGVVASENDAVVVGNVEA